MSSTSPSNSQRVFAVSLAALTWFAIALQLYLTKGSVFNFISYFTILSNILVAISLTFSSLFPETTLGRYFADIKVKSAIALYIFIVGLVYNLVLRGIWDPTGWQLIVDNLLHVAVPIFYVVYWFVFTPRGKLNWIDGIAWAYFPLCYLIYSLIRGHFTKWYPYPFINVTEIGYQKVILNSSLMLIAFVLIGLLLILINKIFKRTDS
jgi:hypothetical protein